MVYKIELLLDSVGIQCLQIDASMLVYMIGGDIVVYLIYISETIVIGINEELIQRMIGKLHSEIIEMVRASGGFHLFQQKYIHHLEKTKLLEENQLAHLFWWEINFQN